MFWSAAVVLLPLIFSPLAHASEATANRVCAVAMPMVNALIDFAQTACVPGREGDGYSLTIFTQQSALQSAAHRKAYLNAVVGAVGKALDDVHGGVGDIRRVSVMDRHLGLQRKYVVIPAADLLRVSRNARADKYETLDQVFAAVERVARTVNLPSK